ncbi:MAG: heavy metal-associated domain-containing protein, partial [Lentisphaeria bacterium]
FDLLLGDYFRPQEISGEHLGWLGLAGALALLALFVYFLIKDWRFWLWERTQQKAVGEERSELKVEGMTCEGCARNVRLAASSQPGVGKVEVDLENGRVVIHGHGFRPEYIREAIEEAGYTVTEVSPKQK